MKKLLTPILLPGIMLFSSTLSGQIVQQWTFGESDGTELSAASNSGSGDFAFDSNLDGFSQIEGGALKISGLNDVVSNNPAFASGSAVVTSSLELSFDVPGFDFSGGDGGGATINVDFLDSGTFLGGLRLRKNGGEVKATLQNDNSLEQALTSGGAVNLPSANISVVMSIDLDTDTYSVSLTGDTGITAASWSSVSFNGGNIASQIDQIRLRGQSNGTGDWGATDYFQIDNLTLTAVPEPSTYALLAGFGALALVLYRRRKG